MKANDVTRYVNKLNRETKEDKVKWGTNTRFPSSLSGDERLVNGIYYIAEIGNEEIRLYKFQSKYYSDEDTFSWSDGLRLEFVDDSGNSRWEFPQNAAIHNLYETVRYKTAGVEKLFESYLSEEPEEDEPNEYGF